MQGQDQWVLTLAPTAVGARKPDTSKTLPLLKYGFLACAQCDSQLFNPELVRTVLRDRCIRVSG